MAEPDLNDTDFLKKVELLQMQRDFYKSLLDTLPFTVFAKNKKGEYVYANKYCNEINGFKNDELIGKTDADILGESNLADDFLESDRIVLDEKKGFERLMPLYIGGEFRYEYMMKEPLVDRNGTLAGVTGAVIPKTLNMPFSMLNTREGILLDYIIESGKIIVLRDHSDFPLFSTPNLTLQQILDSDCLFEDSGRILDEAFSHSVVEDVPIHLIIKMFDKNKRLRFCSLTFSCFFDKNRKPFRISAIIVPIEEDKIKEEQFKIEMENARRQFAILGKAQYDLSIYINIESNFYCVLHSTNDYSKIKVQGQWTSLLKELMMRFCAKDSGVLREIIQGIKSQRDYQTEYRKREFRMKDDRNRLRWKIYKIDRARKDFCDGVILSVNDIHDWVLDREVNTASPDYRELIDVLSTVIEFRGLESDEHITRVRQFTRILLSQVSRSYVGVSFTPQDIDLISLAASIHDIGKIAIPDSILLKPGKLTTEEFEIMKTHTIRGCEILDSIGKISHQKFLEYGRVICKHHHERWDGNGYPDKLKGDQIPIEAQVVALADVFDALTSERCYKQPFSYDTAFSMIINGDCGVFSPNLLDCFRKVRREIVEYARISHKDLQDQGE